MTGTQLAADQPAAAGREGVKTARESRRGSGGFPAPGHFLAPGPWSRWQPVARRQGDWDSLIPGSRV